jgi:hypothetical protein
MRYLVPGVLLLVLAVGCLPADNNHRREDKMPELPYRQVEAPRIETSPDNIDEENAWKIAKQLRAELLAESGR